MDNGSGGEIALWRPKVKWVLVAGCCGWAGWADCVAERSFRPPQEGDHMRMKVACPVSEVSSQSRSREEKVVAESGSGTGGSKFFRG